MLIATELGEPIYRKAGFNKVTDYVFFKKVNPDLNYSPSEEIIPHSEFYNLQILNLDQNVTGEKRQQLLITSLSSSKLIVKDNQLQGFYLPTLGEGLIIANDVDAGLELMKYKYSSVDKAVLPSDNIAGIEFLKSIGFIEAKRGTRMVLGKDVKWHPEKIYSRIGGNFG